MQKIKKGDNVQVLLGKDHGKSGAVERVLAKEDKVLVTGVNTYKRHVSGRRVNMEGGIIDISKPLHVSNLALICPNCKQPTRVGFKMEGNEKMRMCKKCGKEIK